MKKIFGIRVTAFSLILSFLICLTSEASASARKETPVSIPSLYVQEADKNGLFLLVFDISGSMWASDKNDIPEDFKDIYLYLSEMSGIVENEAILFDMDDMQWSKIKTGKETAHENTEQNEEVWKSKKDTDLKNAFVRLDNYLKGISDKSWVRFVMVSDFYDSFKGDEFEVRKESMEKIVSSFNDEERWKLYQNYFIFDSPSEKKLGYKQYIPELDETSGNCVVEVGKDLEKSGIDCHAETKRLFIEKVLQGLTGYDELTWRRLKDILPSDIEKCCDYFVYSDREMECLNVDSENIVWNYPLKSGGYLYHIKNARMKELELDRSTNEYYILMMPHVEATLIYTMAGNERTFREGTLEVKLEIEEKERNLVQAENFQAVFIIAMANGLSDDLEYAWLDKKENGYVGTVKLKPGTYSVHLCRGGGADFLNEIVEKEFIIQKKKE